ncbi:MAG: N-acetyltransferase [Candidatus Aminicenantes bacterium]|nr:N-acetyltransferase [Candidatus Aminicenantes bacterium]
MGKSRQNITIHDFRQNDLDSLLTVFNSFVRNSHAAYPESELNRGQFDKIMAQAKIIVTLRDDEAIIGFGFISSYKPLANFNHTGVLTYFILTDHTSMGLGTRLLYELIRRGREAGISNYLAHFSSRNEQSLNFHRKHGFKEVGRFKQVARKFGELIDVVWVQKQLSPGEDPCTEPC